MAKVESFELDHDLVKAPYVRQAGYEVHQTGAIVTKFDLRFVQPNQDALPTGALHTLEHLLAINIRDYVDGVIDLSPMMLAPSKYQIGIDVMLTSDDRHGCAGLKRCFNDLTFELRWEVGSPTGSTRIKRRSQCSVH